MKVLIIYKSVHHGNTKKVAEVMARGLKAKLVEVDQVNQVNLGDYELVGFGSGIYGWRHHQDLLEFINKLPKQNQKKCFIFSTSGFPGKLQHKRLRNILINKGFRIIGEFNCPGWDTFGPLKIFGGMYPTRPNENDLQKASSFVKNLLSAKI